jgi:hypothetical protein
VGLGDRDPGGVGAGVQVGLDPQPGAVRAAAMVLTTTSWLVSGLPRQFIVICENSRCSILFHFEVPGGKWHTVMARPVSAARRASSAFQTR